MNTADFETDFNPGFTAILNARGAEPSNCADIRRRVQEIRRQFDSRMYSEYSQLSKRLKTSRISPTERVVDLETYSNAYDYAGGNITLKISAAMQNINTRCAALDSNSALDTAQRALERLSVTQANNATRLAPLIQTFNDEIQAIYVPLENLILEKFP